MKEETDWWTAAAVAKRVGPINTITTPPMRSGTASGLADGEGVPRRKVPGGGAPNGPVGEPAGASALAQYWHVVAPAGARYSEGICPVADRPPTSNGALGRAPTTTYFTVSSIDLTHGQTQRYLGDGDSRRDGVRPERWLRSPGFVTQLLGLWLTARSTGRRLARFDGTDLPPPVALP